METWTEYGVRIRTGAGEVRMVAMLDALKRQQGER